MDAFPDKVLEGLHGRRLLLGLSGGMDSTVLLHLLAVQRDRFAGLRAIHVDHGLQPGSADWSAHCRATCAALGIALLERRVDVRTRGQGLEAAAREARMASFADALAGDETLVLAQHRDDQAETLLLRLLRGAGSDGLGAMRAERRFAGGWLARPLLDTPRARLHDYAVQHGLHWIEDASNADQRHDRNHLRHAILPALRARWPHADRALATSARLAAEDAALLAEGAALRLDATRLPGSTDALSVASLLALSPPWRARVLRAWIALQGLPPAPAPMHARIDAELLEARRDSQAQVRWPGATLLRWRDGLHARAPAALPGNAWRRDWDGAGWLVLPDGSRLGFEPVLAGDAVQTGGAVLAGDAVATANAVLAADATSPVTAAAATLQEDLRREFGALHVQPRQGGERLRLPGRSHHHRLKHLLQDSGLPPWQRDRLPLLFASDGELLAAGDRLLAARLQSWADARACTLRWRAADD